VAMLLGWLLLGESPHGRTAFAAAFILGGVVLMQTGRRKREGEQHAKSQVAAE